MLVLASIEEKLQQVLHPAEELDEKTHALQDGIIRRAARDDSPTSSEAAACETTRGELGTRRSGGCLRSTILWCVYLGRTTQAKASTEFSMDDLHRVGDCQAL